MPQITIQTAASLTQCSTRTIRRRLAAGLLKNKGGDEDSGKQTVCFESIQADIPFALNPDDIELIKSADSGDPDAQNDLGLLFLENEQSKTAVHWLELAAGQNVSDAMQLLGDCYLQGKGRPKDNNLAIMWIAKAASMGHSIAIAQMASIHPA
ncbi:Sel1 repeat-containing protein [Candidatus Methylobacter favarea]|uniref:Sel1 repeat-containing protein n=1 Tax=Candidatus Methylobacter favarea TaxID=2707345 RepID=A0A8S0YAJ2_9GAMM|nr:SEL1-like repeat protein [Candidatus Methylobacter favarea]CAA9892017.1 Sel1 repeat-containing protein [Candidatus Methylobacter favarea]